MILGDRRVRVRSDDLLRCGMRLDAAISMSLGITLLVAADSVSALSGLSATTERLLGASFVGISAVVFVAAALPDIRRTGKSLMVGNLMFAVLSVVTVLANWLPLTPSGVVQVLATGLYMLCDVAALGHQIDVAVIDIVRKPARRITPQC